MKTGPAFRLITVLNVAAAVAIAGALPTALSAAPLTDTQKETQAVAVENSMIRNTQSLTMYPVVRTMSKADFMANALANEPPAGDRTEKYATAIANYYSIVKIWGAQLTTLLHEGTDNATPKEIAAYNVADRQLTAIGAEVDKLGELRLSVRAESIKPMPLAVAFPAVAIGQLSDVGDTAMFDKDGSMNEAVRQAAKSQIANQFAAKVPEDRRDAVRGKVGADLDLYFADIRAINDLAINAIRKGPDVTGKSLDDLTFRIRDAHAALGDAVLQTLPKPAIDSKMSFLPVPASKTERRLTYG